MAPNYDGRTYYQILGVGHDASDEQIKRSYRERVLQCHPDVNPGPDGITEFKMVRRAYEVLSDNSERQRYNLLMGLSGDTGRKSFYRRCFDRLFDNLFSGLRATLDITPLVNEATDGTRKKAG